MIEGTDTLNSKMKSSKDTYSPDRKQTSLSPIEKLREQRDDILNNMSTKRLLAKV